MTTRKQMSTPSEITEDASRHALEITWDDGHRSRYTYRTLRQLCPCAHCVDEWTGEKRLDPGRVAANIHPTEINRVGAYALRFAWSDGHGTGIYTFTFLRSICECDACAAARATTPTSEGR
jgi:DUF971 family protein